MVTFFGQNSIENICNIVQRTHFELITFYSAKESVTHNNKWCKRSDPYKHKYEWKYSKPINPFDCTHSFYTHSSLISAAEMKKKT